VRSVRNAIRALGYELKEVIEEEQRELDWLEIRPRASNSTSGKLNPRSLFLLLLLPLLLLSSPPSPPPLQVESAADISSAERLIFPGVGAFEQAMGALKERKLLAALRDYVAAGDRPFLGICLGLQLLFEGSEENGGVEGLGLIPGRVERFDESKGLPIPHIGWNDLALATKGGASPPPPPPLLSRLGDRRVYFVHSFRAVPSVANAEWVAATSEYAGDFVAALSRGSVAATQFHPEKSGAAGLDVLRGFLEGPGGPGPGASPSPAAPPRAARARGLAKRVIACLDVRANDAGDLVVTKGDQYDVREAPSGEAQGGARAAASGPGQPASGDVRNLGKPVDLAARYYAEGADEVTFLNITGFRDAPLADLPMLAVLRAASERVFVPLTVGGGIREATDPDGTRHSALEVAAEYFRSGADKVSIGSDAVEAALAWYARGRRGDGGSAIERISWAYGAQAVVVSVDPRRVWVADPRSTPRPAVRVTDGRRGPGGEEFCWWQCTVRGGREGRDLDAVELAVACEALGAGEILLNCIDRDGTGEGFDLDLVRAVSDAVGIPVIASSGAGRPAHFAEVFAATGCSAALAAGIFHRKEVGISEVKGAMDEAGIPSRVA